MKTEIKRIDSLLKALKEKRKLTRDVREHKKLSQKITMNQACLTALKLKEEK